MVVDVVIVAVVDVVANVVACVEDVKDGSSSKQPRVYSVKSPLHFFTLKIADHELEIIFFKFGRMDRGFVSDL